MKTPKKTKAIFLKRPSEDEGEDAIVAGIVDALAPHINEERKARGLPPMVSDRPARAKMAGEKKVNYALIEQVNKDFTRGVNEYREGVRKGTIEHPHDAPHRFVRLDKQDDHLKPLPEEPSRRRRGVKGRDSVMCPACGHEFEPLRENIVATLRVVAEAHDANPELTTVELARKLRLSQAYVSKLLKIRERVHPDVLALWERSLENDAHPLTHHEMNALGYALPLATSKVRAQRAEYARLLREMQLKADRSAVGNKGPRRRPSRA